MSRKSLLITDIDAIYTCDDASVGYIPGPAAIGFDTSGSIDFIGKHPNSTYDLVIESPLGCIALPGLVDCHTHAVWAGSRSNEFSRRINGEDYSKILEEGGGIRSTVAATRKAILEELIDVTTHRLRRMLRYGVTTVEIKSGYGLDVDTEVKILRAAKVAGQAEGVPRVKTTFLGAHVIPNEYHSEREAYVKQVITEQLPACKPFADAIDVFCDKGAFTLVEAEAILRAGKTAGLQVKAHAEQITHTGVAELVASLGGLSADHLERLDERGAKAMAAAGTVAVFLPGAQLYMKDSAPPVRMLRDAGVKIAVATDLNPGTSPVHDLLNAATLSCILQGLTVKEAVLGITRNAGIALGDPRLGRLAIGSSVGDLVLIKPAPGEPAAVETLIQHLGGHEVRLVVKDGSVVYNAI